MKDKKCFERAQKEFGKTLELKHRRDNYKMIKPKLCFEWDPIKNDSNFRKHGVTFEKAIGVFFDERAVVIADPDNSGEEERFLILGFSTKARLLVVCHCLRNEGETIRIISARKATHREAAHYRG